MCSQAGRSYLGYRTSFLHGGRLSELVRQKQRAKLSVFGRGAFCRAHVKPLAVTLLLLQDGSSGILSINLAVAAVPYRWRVDRRLAGRVLSRVFASEAPVRSLGSTIVIVFPLAVLGFAFAPPQVVVLACVAAFYGAANGMITIVRGLAVLEMVTRDAYGAVNGSLVAPINLMQAVAPLGAAVIWQASGGYGAVLAGIFAGSLTLCAGFWFAAAQSRAK
jgi:hypothetical protein